MRKHTKTKSDPQHRIKLQLSYFSSPSAPLNGKASSSKSKSSIVDHSGGKKSKVTKGIKVAKYNSTFGDYATRRLGIKNIICDDDIIPINIDIIP